ncbi:hypothetical protein BH18ACT9_BH18ACT9_01670 [soil metagenome]
MTTAPRISGSGPRPGSIGSVVRPAIILTLLVGLLAATAGMLLDGLPGLLGALVGTGIVVVFFGLGVAVLDGVTRFAPAASVLVALVTYTLKVLLVGLVFIGLFQSGAMETAIDAQWLGGTVIAATVAWLSAQVRTSTRARIPLYDLTPNDSPRHRRTGRGEPPGGASGSVSGANQAGAQ